MTLPPISPGRRLVTAPQSGSIGTEPLPDVADLHEGGPYGDVLIAGLIRAQLGLTLGFLSLTIAVIGSFPLLATLFPGLLRITVDGLPLTLVVLGVAIYPVLVILAWGYVHLAERLERRFGELLRRPT
jgi:hypothetical protein